jgi:regulator of protease activity HflC (stomatin/prohibitin superfamily)
MPSNPQPFSKSVAARQKEFFSPETLLGTFRNNMTLLKVGLILLIALYLFSGVTIVRYGESAIQVRMGKIIGPVHDSGLLIAFPPPIDRIYKFPTQQIQELKLDAWVPSEERIALWHKKVRTETKSGPMIDLEDPTQYLKENHPWPTQLHPVLDGYSLTGDANIIGGVFTLRYRIVDPIQYYLTLYNKEQKLLPLIAYQAIARTVAEMSIDSLFSDQRGIFAANTKLLIQQQLDALDSGISVQGFEISTIAPPVQVLEAFQEVINAQVENSTLLENANSDFATVALQTAAETRKIELEGNAKRLNLIAQAEGKAAAFQALLEEANNNLPLYRSRIRTETLNRIFRNLTTTTLLPSQSSDLQYWLPQEASKNE